jgi:Ca-activated chloride channel family protein
MTERPEETENTGLEADIWREEGPWLLLPLLPLAALAFRRGVLAVWLLVFLLPIKPAEAFEWTELWSRPDQRATRALMEGDPAGAAQLFNDPAWKGAANYQAGRYEESIAALDGLDGLESAYNRGNALAKLGRYDEAIAAYENVLERDPKHHDASYNRELLLEQMKQQQQSEDGETDPSGESPEDEQDSSEGKQSADEPSATGSSADESSAGQQRDEPAMADAGQRPEDLGVPPEPAEEQDAETTAQQAEPDAAEDGQPEDTQADMAMSKDQPPDEDAQATEQWLRKIPDDPGGLLRRKFYYQYQQQSGQQTEDEQW